MARPLAPDLVGRGDAWSWTELLESIAHATALEVDPEQLACSVHCALSAAGEDDAEDWTERLVLACEGLGLCARRLHGTVAQAAAAVGPEHPVVARTADGGWLVLVDRRGRSILVDEPGSSGPVWLRQGELAERTDPETVGAVAWVAIDPPGLLSFGASERAGERAASEPSTPPAPTPFARLRVLLRQERHDLFVVLVYAIGVGVLTLATPIAVQALVNTVAFGTLVQPLVVLALLLLAGLTFAAVLRAFSAWVVEVLQRRLFLRLAGDLAHRLPRVRLSVFDRAHGPELLNRFFDVFSLQKSVASLLLGGLELILAALVGMVVLAFYHPLLFAFDLLLIAVVVVILFLLGRGATRTALEESKRKYAIAAWLEEVARHPLAFKLAGGPRLARERTDRLAASYLTARSAHYRIVFRQLVAALALQAFASAGVLGIGGWLVIERQLTLGQLVAAELIVTAVVASFAKMGKHLETSYDLLASLDKLGQLADLALELAAPVPALPLGSSRGARLTAHRLGFAHPLRERLLSGVDLTLAPGDRVAIHGTSGAGRTTLTELLVGLRTPTEGRVEIDGADLRELQRGGPRERVALVGEPQVLAATIGENVAFGRSEMGSTVVREALRAVDLLDDVARLPEGLRTQLTPDGRPLSRSQAVRLTLARAIAGKPALLVLDGALDGLDGETRARVLDALFRSDAPWTLLVVTDHPAVAARCTRTLALVDGSLEEVS